MTVLAFALRFFESSFLRFCPLANHSKNSAQKISKHLRWFAIGGQMWRLAFNLSGGYNHQVLF
jgi:hypothetical protein